MTKTVTAAGLLHLVSTGQVELDSPVTRYAPEFHLTRSEASVSSITVRHLLTQSSGLPDEGTVWTWPDSRDGCYG